MKKMLMTVISLVLVICIMMPSVYAAADSQTSYDSVMDLMNDAAGYVANPANFCLAGIQYNEEREDYDSDTWCLISYGKGAATAFISNFYEIFDSVR